MHLNDPEYLNDPGHITYEKEEMKKLLKLEGLYPDFNDLEDVIEYEIVVHSDLNLKMKKLMIIVMLEVYITIAQIST